MATSFIIDSVDANGKKYTKTVPYVNPDATNEQLRALAEGLNSLTSNTYVSGTRVEKTDFLDDGGLDRYACIVGNLAKISGESFNSEGVMTLYFRYLPLFDYDKIEDDPDVKITISGKKPRGATITTEPVAGQLKITITKPEGTTYQLGQKNIPFSVHINSTGGYAAATADFMLMGFDESEMEEI